MASSTSSAGAAVAGAAELAADIERVEAGSEQLALLRLLHLVLAGQVQVDPDRAHEIDRLTGGGPARRAGGPGPPRPTGDAIRAAALAGIERWRCGRQARSATGGPSKPRRSSSAPTNRSTRRPDEGEAVHDDGPSLDRLAARATTHCLTGCAIGEVLGLVIATQLGWHDLPSVVLAIALAFTFGYALTIRQLLRPGSPFAGRSAWRSPRTRSRSP